MNRPGLEELEKIIVSKKKKKKKTEEEEESRRRTWEEEEEEAISSRGRDGRFELRTETRRRNNTK